MRHIAYGLMVTAILSVQAAHAAPERKELAVGDPAPPLTIQRWLKGPSIEGFEKGKIYVVEFGATWCPPCRKAIPHLTELTKQYAGKIAVVSVFARERSNKEDPTDLRYIDKVLYQMQAMGEKMDFPIAVDVPQQTTGDAWKINGVPSAFVVDGEGKIAWKGHPTALDPVMAQLVAGTFDPQKAMQDQQAFTAATAEVRKLEQAKEYAAALTKLDEVMAVNPHASYLYMMKYRVLASHDDKKADALLQWMLDEDMAGFDWDHFIHDTYTVSKNPNYDLALATAERAVQRSETKLVAGHMLQQKASIYLHRSKQQTNEAAARQDIARAVEAMQQAVELSRSTGDPKDVAYFTRTLQSHQFKLWAGADDAKANALLKSLLDDNPDGVEWQGYITDAIERQKEPDYTLLLAAADRAIANSKEGANRAYPLSKKADVYAAKGDTAQALATYQQAVDAAKEGGSAQSIERYEKTLAEFKAKSAN